MGGWAVRSPSHSPVEVVLVGWTSPEDVLDSWIGLDAPTDVVLLQRWIERAEREIRYRVPSVSERITALEPDLLETVQDIVAAMVTRVFRNPEGIRTVNESSGTGPFSASVSRTYGGDQPGGLALLDGELARLRGERSSRAFTVSMIPTTSPFAEGHLL